MPARSAASLAQVTDPAARGRLEDERLKLQHDVRLPPAAGRAADLWRAAGARLVESC